MTLLNSQKCKLRKKDCWLYLVVQRRYNLSLSYMLKVKRNVLNELQTIFSNWILLIEVISIVHDVISYGL